MDTDSDPLGTWHALPGLAWRDGPERPPPGVPVTVSDRRGAPTLATFDPAAAQPGALVSCLMVTRGALVPARHAIECFRAQTYAERELLIVDDSVATPLASWVAALADPRIRHVRLPPSAQTLGDLRNLAVALAAGDLVCQWDDDDLYDPLRIEFCVRALEAAAADAVFLGRWLMWWPQTRRFTVSARALWEGSMLARRAAMPFYPGLRLGEDTIVTHALRDAGRIASLDLPWLYCYNITGRNSWDAMHFESMFLASTVRFAPEEYERALAELDRRMPVRAFARDLDDTADDGSPAGAGSGTVAADAPVLAATPFVEPRAEPVDHAPAAPKVSLVVRSMGGPRLADALASLAGQTYRNIEVVVVDGTGGRSAALPPLPAALDVRLVCAERPRHRAAAANAGLAFASGDWLGLVDDDDLLEPTHVGRLIERAAAADNPDLVFAAGWQVDRRQRILGELDDPYNALTAYFNSPFPAVAVLFSRRHWDRGHRLDETLDTMEDWEFWLQLTPHARVGRSAARTYFHLQPATPAIGQRPSAAEFETNKRLQGRWQLRRNSLWLAHYKRFAPGIALQGESRHAEASVHFARLLADTPGEPNALFQLGQSVGQEGWLYAARKLVEAAIRLNRNAAEYHIALARVEEALGNHDAAIRAFEDAAKVGPAHDTTAAREIARIRASGHAAPASHARAGFGDGPVARNAPCPCGSGLRYKACHGAATGSTAAALAPATPIDAEARTQALAAAADAYRRGELDAAGARCDALLAANPGDAEALHVRALIAFDRGDLAAAQRALDAIPAPALAEAEVQAFRAQLLQAAQRRSENGNAIDRCRELPFLRHVPTSASTPAASLHIVVAGNPSLLDSARRSAMLLRAALAGLATVSIWLADADDPAAAIGDECLLAPERGAFPREGAVLFAGAPALPQAWLARANVERVAVRYWPDRATDMLELIVGCHRHTGLPVQLLHAGEASRARLDLPGCALRDPLACGLGARGAPPERRFVVGMAGHNDAREFHPDVAPLLRSIAARGSGARVRGGTVLLRNMAPSAPHPAIELLPTTADDPAAFLAAVDCFVFYPAWQRPAELRSLIDDAMAAGLPVLCARGTDEAELIDDGVDGFLFDRAADALEIVERLARDRAFARRVGAAAAATAQASFGADYGDRLRALLLG